MNNLYRLVYTSFRKPVCNEEEIQKILASCKKNNPGTDVSGILLHSNSRFIQYIEGRKENVEALYEKIKDDPRHTAVNRRSFEPISSRVFPNWQMGYKDISTEKLKLRTDSTKEDARKFEELLSAELDFENDGMRVLQLFFRD